MELTVGELAKAADLRPSAIRYYESLGLIQARRTVGGQRRYEKEALTQIRSIVFARSAGFTLQEIRTLHGSVDAGGPLFHRWRDVAERKLSELDEVITRAEEMKRRLRQGLDCLCTESSDCPLVNGQRDGCQPSTP